MRRLIALALALALSAGSAAAAPPPVADAWQPAFDEMDTLFRDYARENHVPGLVFGVVRDGRIVHLGAIGVQNVETQAPVTDETVFRIASLTKSFTALALLRLRDEGRVDIDAPAETLVPELRDIAYPTPKSRRIRLRDLLTHTAGFVTDDPWGDRQLDMTEPAFSALIRGGMPFAREPGEGFDYSNYGYALVGRAISNASGRPYQAYISDTILAPLGMTSTVWERTKVPEARRAIGYSWADGRFEPQPSLSDGAFGAMAGLQTDARDYGRYVAWLLSAWTPQASSPSGIVDPASVREAGRGAVLSQVGSRENGPGGKPCPVAWMYGYGFYVVSDCELGTMVRHPGGLPGFGSQLLLLPEDGVGIFAFANLTYAHLSGPVVEAALRLHRAGLLQHSDSVPSLALSGAADTVLRVYQAQDVTVARDGFAMNLLLDRSVERRNADLKALRASLGACRAVRPGQVLNALAGEFTLSCERGEATARILMSPTNPPHIQFLELQPVSIAGEASK